MINHIKLSNKEEFESKKFKESKKLNPEVYKEIYTHAYLMDDNPLFSGYRYVEFMDSDSMLYPAIFRVDSDELIVASDLESILEVVDEEMLNGFMKSYYKLGMDNL